MAAKNKSNEIKITRIYDASKEQVWDAWTDPEQVGQWWGPRGFTLTTHGKDLRPGGYWSYTMHGPDGTDYENKTDLGWFDSFSFASFPGVHVDGLRWRPRMGDGG